MQTKRSRGTQGMAFYKRFSLTQKRFLFLFTVCSFIVVIEFICFKIVPTKLKADIPLKVEIKPDLLNIVNSSNPEIPLKVEIKSDLMTIVNPSDRKYAMPMNGPYRLENTTFCSSTTTITVLVIVLSTPNHFIDRRVIRQTWANGSLFSNYGTVRTLFLLGRTYNVTVETKIAEEFRLFGDIVQGNFVDSLRNLTHKSIMGYNWVMKRCANVKYVIKTDDDIVLNMFEMLQKGVLETALKNHHVFCSRYNYSKVIRNRQIKIYVEPHQFRGIKYYPPYCHGQFVAMVNDVVPYLYEAAILTPYFWIDDVHMYGLSMNNIPALKYKQLKKEETGTYKDIKLLEQNKTRQTLYFVTTNSIQVVNLWSALFNVYR